MRTCEVCKERKTLRSFKKNNSPSGRAKVCRACQNKEKEEVVHFDAMDDIETR